MTQLCVDAVSCSLPAGCRCNRDCFEFGAVGCASDVAPTSGAEAQTISIASIYR